MNLYKKFVDKSLDPCDQLMMDHSEDYNNLNLTLKAALKKVENSDLDLFIDGIDPEGTSFKYFNGLQLFKD